MINVENVKSLINRLCIALGDIRRNFLVIQLGGVGLVNEEKLKEYISSKCYELCGRYDAYISSKNRFKREYNLWISRGELADPFFVLCSSDDVGKNWKQFDEERFLVRQFCGALGDDYVEIYNDIVGKKLGDVNDK